MNTIISMILLPLLVVGCASSLQMTDYEQGCYDGLDYWFKDRPEYDNLKINTCAGLADKRKPRTLREFKGMK